MAKNWEETVMTPQDMLDVMYSIPKREPGEDYSRLNEAMCRKQAKISHEARDGEIKEAVSQERERLIGIINNHDSIGYPYGADFKSAILQALKGEDDG